MPPQDLAAPQGETSCARSAAIRLAFFGLTPRHTLPFFLLLRHALGADFECLYYTRRERSRRLLRAASVPRFPKRWQWPAKAEVSDEELRQALGPRVWAQRGAAVLPAARRRYAAIAAFLERQKVDAVFAWNGSTLPSALAVHLARQRGLPVVFGENGYLPGTMQIDAEGVNHDASITRLLRLGAARLPPQPRADAALDALIAAYRAGRPIRETGAAGRGGSGSLGSAIRRLWPRDRWLGNADGGAAGGEALPALPERFVFLPFQVRRDSQLLVHSPVIGNDMAAFLAAVHAACAAIDPALRVVVKLHPEERPAVQRGYRELAKLYPDVLFTARHRVSDLVAQACAVATVNSTVGFEGILLDKPVVALGRNFYVAPQLVEVVSRLDELPQALARAVAGPTDREARRAFLRFVHGRFLAHGELRDRGEASLRAVAERIRALVESQRRSPGAAPQAPSAACERFA